MAFTAAISLLRPAWAPARAPLPRQAAFPASLRPCRQPSRAAGQPEAASISSAEPSSSSSSVAAPPPPVPAPPPAPSKADSLPPERLKQLRRDGLALKDVIKMGRRGPAEGLASQVRQRWNTSEVARLYCHGKHAANMKLLIQQLEEVTGGIVVHRAGGTVLLYRGDGWQRQAAEQQAGQQPVAPQQQAAVEQQVAVQQQQQQPAEPDS